MDLLKMIRRLIHGIAKEYSVFYIYGNSIQHVNRSKRKSDAIAQQIFDKENILGVKDENIRKRLRVSGDDAFCFGVWKNDELASICWVLGPHAYSNYRNFWILSEREAKMVYVFTSEKFRGQGLAVILEDFASRRMCELGYRRLYSRIWHSNRASIRVHQKLGWEKIALVVELKLNLLRYTIRFERYYDDVRIRIKIKRNNLTNIIREKSQVS